MIPAVFFLAKCSVFEMLWLESDTQQTNGTFVFCKYYGHWRLKKMMEIGVQQEQGFLSISV